MVPVPAVTTSVGGDVEGTLLSVISGRVCYDGCFGCFGCNFIHF